MLKSDCGTLRFKHLKKLKSKMHGKEKDWG